MKKNYKKDSIDASELNHKFYCIGVEKFKNKRFTRAKQAFETSIEYWPQDAQAWFALGNCFDELNKPSRAEKCFKEALLYSIEEDKSKIYYNLGNALYDQGRISEAKKYYNMVSAQSKAYILAQKNLDLIEDGKTD